MRFVNISEHGGPEVMEIKEGEGPDPGKGEVLIRVHAVGVNRVSLGAQSFHEHHLRRLGRIHQSVRLKLA